jgi:hypothetical protein
MNHVLLKFFVVFSLCFNVAAHADTANSDSALGINLTGISYWSSQWMLVDIMKQASNGSGQLWATTNADTYKFDTKDQALLDLDEQGWPRSLPNRTNPNFHYVTTILYQDNQHYPIGDYVVLYDGEGELTFRGGNIVESQPGRIVLRMEESSFLQLQILSTDPQQTGNYLRNIRVLVPGGRCNSALTYASSPADCQQASDYQAFEQIYQEQVFHPLFLKDMQGFRALRYMQFLHTINNPVRVWEERSKADYASWALNGGSPIEVAIHMANQLQAEPWLNIPVRVDDNYLRQYALLVKNQLAPNLTLYLEYGNEIWNNAYPYNFDADYAAQQGKQLWPLSNVSDLEYRLSYYGMRSAQACAIWKQVFSDAPQRVQCVMGGMGANTWINEQALQCPVYMQNGGYSCARDMDALAIAPYFAGYLADNDNLSILLSWVSQGELGLQYLFDEMYSGVLRLLSDDNDKEEWQLPPVDGALAQAKEFIATNKVLADRYGLSLVAYEGGQHLSYAGNMTQQRDKINDELFLKANRDALMGQAIVDHLNDWQQNGGTTYVLFESIGKYGEYGAFPLKEYQLQDESEKFKAVSKYIKEQSCWWLDCHRDTIDYSDNSSSQDDDSLPDANSGQLNLTIEPVIETMGVALHWDWQGAPVASFRVLMDGELIGNLNSAARGYETHWLSLRQDYSFKVQAIDDDNLVIAESNKIISQAGDSISPTRPANLTVEFDGNSGYILNWQASEDNVAVSHYKIFRNGEPYTLAISPSFIDPWPPEGQVSYYVVAEDNSQNLSEPSFEVVGRN